jgi:Fe-S-cluster containining protein
MMPLPLSVLKAASTEVLMECRKCGACCIAPSINSAMPDMPQGKPAGVRCRHLDDHNLCVLFGRPERPAFCPGWQPAPDVCGADFDEAMANIEAMEAGTSR